MLKHPDLTASEDQSLAQLSLVWESLVSLSPGNIVWYFLSYLRRLTTPSAVLRTPKLTSNRAESTEGVRARVTQLGITTMPGQTPAEQLILQAPVAQLLYVAARLNL